MSTSEFPPVYMRLFSVWYRHMRVYTKNIFSNGFPPFLEPIIFLVGIGFGLGRYIETMDGVPYVEYLATGLIVTTAMFTATFECTFGTFIRLEFDKVYDGMLAAPLSVNDLLVGEILWAGTKGFFFSLSVLVVMFIFNVLPISLIVIAPWIGFITGTMFASIALVVTSFVKDINNLNFYFTGIISPMFFFSGVVFPISNLPEFVQPLVEIFPLTHVVRLIRAFSFQRFGLYPVIDTIYCVGITLLFVFLAIYRLKGRLTK